jgi:hypothetical protein
MPRKKETLTPLSKEQKEKLEDLASKVWAGVPGAAAEFVKYASELRKAGVPSGLIDAVAKREMNLRELQHQTLKTIEKSKKLVQLTDPFGGLSEGRKKRMSRKKGKGY